MKKVVVLGGKGIGMIAAAIIDRLADVELIGLLNDGVPIGSTQGRFKRVPVIGTSEDVHRYIADPDVYALVAYKTMKEEKEMWEKLQRLNIPREKLINVIHPSVQIPDGYCYIGNGVMMVPEVQIGVDTHISDNCILLAKSFIGHDSTLDRYVTVANHASIGAEVHVGKAVHIGSNATIAAGVTVGDFSLVGIGAVVLKDVPPNAIVAGVPAKVLRIKD